MTKNIQDVYIVKFIRTPVCRANRGGLATVRPDDLLSHVLSGVLTQTGIDSTEIEDIIIGCAMPEAEQGMNVARIAALLAGYSNSAPAITINRFCSSGLQSIAMAADRIRTRDADVVVAGGVESMSMIPMGGYNYRANSRFFTDENVSIAYGMGLTAEIVAKKFEITREQQDEFSYHSHQKALAAINKKLFEKEILPYKVMTNRLKNGSIKTEETIIYNDDGPRADTSIEKLATLPSVFKFKGTVTAGSSSQMSDGAAAVLLVSEKALKKYNLNPIARFCGFTVTGVAPELMGIGPVTAVKKCVEKCNLKLSDIGHIELNEAFAAQSLAVIKELDLDMSVVNPQGGAIALGHPLGATGTIKACTMLSAMLRNNFKYGMVTMCIGTGMGAAGIFEKS